MGWANIERFVYLYYENSQNLTFWVRKLTIILSDLQVV